MLKECTGLAGNTFKERFNNHSKSFRQKKYSKETESSKYVWTLKDNWINYVIKGVLHPWALFLKTLCIFSKNKATSDKVPYGSGQKCSKELKNHSFTQVETIVVKLQ